VNLTTVTDRSILGIKQPDNTVMIEDWEHSYLGCGSTRFKMEFDSYHKVWRFECVKCGQTYYAKKVD